MFFIYVEIQESRLLQSFLGNKKLNTLPHKHIVFLEKKLDYCTIVTCFNVKAFILKCLYLWYIDKKSWHGHCPWIISFKHLKSSIQANYKLYLKKNKKTIISISWFALWDWSTFWAVSWGKILYITNIAVEV